MRHRLLAPLLAPLLAVAAGCGETATMSMDMSPPPAPLPICTTTLPDTARPSYAAGSTTLGACTEASTALTGVAAADIAPDGYLPLGPALTFAGFDGPFPHGIDIVVSADLGKAPAGAPSARIVVVEKRAAGQVVVVPASNIVYEAAYHRLHFHAPELGTYQAAIPKTAGTTFKRHFTYRAIGGVSMGGIGSSMNFWRNPDRYDGIAVMGADPGPDLSYTLGLLQDWFFAGFCTVEDEAKDPKNKVGTLCASVRKPMTDQYEESMDFEHLLYQKGEGVGLTLRRPLYIRAFRDLSRALGNAAYASDPKSGAVGATYLPPGIPASTLALQNAVACDPMTAKTNALKNFYDWRYNPAGKYDVITFCDGGDSEVLGLGVFDPNVPQTDPSQIILAVDLNGNGVRDQGEPVVLQGSERFYDWGTDMVPDEKEPGYDPIKNPDPNHDNYHWYFNPTGTEKNWRYDAGEKYDDCGVDGVCGKGCTVGSAAGCYDFGEGNKTFDLAPNSVNWYAHDPHSLISGYLDVKGLAQANPSALDRLDTFYDAGIRDFLNAQVSTNSLMGTLMSVGQTVRVWDGYPAMTGLAPSDEPKFNMNNVDWKAFGRHVYVRYGNPDATQSEIENDGDGRHVGTVTQAVHRGQALFYFLSSVWPGGDVDTDVNGGTSVDLTFTAKNGRVTPYSVVTPPGYNDDKNATKTYPVAYLMHGYGMKPADLANIAVVANSAMVNENVPASRRMQKMIIVLVDAVCRPGGDVKDGPLRPDGDLCEEGTFYAEHPDGIAKGESQLTELENIIDKNFRVRPPADVEVTQ